VLRKNVREVLLHTAESKQFRVNISLHHRNMISEARISGISKKKDIP
jgi:hypothetical protein